jgi:hypothetical protein
VAVRADLGVGTLEGHYDRVAAAEAMQEVVELSYRRVLGTEVCIGSNGKTGTNRRPPRHPRQRERDHHRQPRIPHADRRQPVHRPSA